MKPRLPFLACLLCLACTPKTYTVEGIYTAENGTPVHLIDLDKGDTLAVTSVQDNRFSFTGKTDAPRYVYVGQGRERIRFILEPGTVTADIDERTSGGTPMVDAYNAFHTRFYRYDALRNQERKALGDMEAQALNEAWAALDRKYAGLQGDLTDSLVRLNRDNLLGALALDDLATKDTARFMALYRDMSPAMQEFFMLRGDRDDIVLRSRTAPGKMFTDYLVKGGNPDGTDVRLSDYVGKGKYILLDHWASWCGPCIAEMPYLKKTWEAFAGDRFDIVSIAVSDKREDTVGALARLDMPWNQILDGQKIPSDLYNISAIPHLILFAPDGTILQRGLRGEQIYATVAQLLSEE